MRALGNFLWFVLGGLVSGLGWITVGCLWCITLIGIQCFKLAGVAFFSFGKEIVYGNGVGNLLVNIIWLIFSGLEMAIGYALWGCLLCVTIVGIPFGKQFFKPARLSLMLFGATVMETR